MLSLLLALQFSLASVLPSWAHAHVSGELVESAAGAASIRTVTSADASKYGLQKSSGSNTLYDPVTQVNYAVGKDGLIYEVSSLSGFNPIPLSKPLTSVGNGGLLNITAANSSASERAAADHMAGLGRNVELRDPVGTRAGGGTSDLLVDGVPYDVYTPTSANPNRTISAIAKKNDQATGIVVDLSNSPVTEEQLGNVLGRVNGAGATNITDILIIGN